MRHRTQSTFDVHLIFLFLLFLILALPTAVFAQGPAEAQGVSAPAPATDQATRATAPTTVAAAGASSGETCECLEASCGPCEVEAGTSFYSAKCGPGLSKVKSCKKVACEPVENQKQCLALLKTSAPQEATGAATQSASAQAEGRMPASQKVPVGSVDQVSGAVSVQRGAGGLEKLSKGMAVFKGDVIETKADGKVRIILKDTTETTLAANARLKIDDLVVGGGETPSRVMMDLLMGKVRNRVHKKYEGQDRFVVRTKTAVAGVRGTDFVTMYAMVDDKLTTEISTLEGQVRLAVDTQELETPTGANIDVPAGHRAGFIRPIIKGADGGDDDSSASLGTFTALLVLKDDDIDSLKTETDFAPIQALESQPAARLPASKGSPDDVCTAPSGKFNQCSWSCEGNPAGEKKCRTDLPSVSCVRRLCRANGLWVEPKRLPASQSGFCQAGQVIVGDCGQYW